MYSKQLETMDPYIFEVAESESESRLTSSRSFYLKSSECLAVSLKPWIYMILGILGLTVSSTHIKVISKLNEQYLSLIT